MSDGEEGLTNFDVLMKQISKSQQTSNTKDVSKTLDKREQTQTFLLGSTNDQKGEKEEEEQIGDGTEEEQIEQTENARGDDFFKAHFLADMEQDEVKEREEKKRKMKKLGFVSDIGNIFVSSELGDPTLEVFSFFPFFSNCFSPFSLLPFK